MKSVGIGYIYGIVVLLFVISSTGCYYRTSCDQSDNVKLGDIDYSDDMKQWNIEDTTKVMTFVGKDRTYVLHRRDTDRRPHHLKEKNICESVDIKPQFAYSYYEYPNLESQFHADSILFVIYPYIQKTKDERVEEIVIGFDHALYAGMYGRIPIDSTKSLSENRSRPTFTHHSSLKVGDQTYTDVWKASKENESLYYSKKKGIVAFEEKGKYYHRQ